MSNKILEELTNHILLGSFVEAKSIILTLNNTEITESIYKISFNTENIMVYGFLRYMYESTNNVLFLECCVRILCLDMSSIEGAYSLALYHQTEITRIVGENIGNLEMMLYFNSIPEKLITDTEAGLYAQKILVLDPKNNLALDFLNRKENKILELCNGENSLE